jgi:hypothetical protein
LGQSLGLVQTLIFCEVRTKAPYFSHTTHPSITNQSLKPYQMASKSSGDGHHSHPTPLPMPSLALVALETINFATGLMKQPPWQRKDMGKAGLGFFSAQQDVLRRGDQ